MKHAAPRHTDSLETWLNYWSHVHVTGIDLGLERVAPVAEWLGLTQPTAKIFTVAGTNGKGSTTTTLASILYEAGYSVGLYQSPHIRRFNERVKFNNQEIDGQSLIDAFVQVDQARRYCGLSLSFFEATTLAAFIIFKQKQCDVWVLEVGLGGRLDVVNIVDPDVAVITNIGLDHVDWLGDSIEKIAYEKAGIMRPNIPVVFAGSQELPHSIQEKACQVDAQLFVRGKDYFFQDVGDGKYWSFASSGVTLRLPIGSLALENMSAAVAALLLSGLKISHEAFCKGIQHTKLSGRFEVKVVGNKAVIFDAGHNVHGIDFLVKQLKVFLEKNKQYTKVTAVFSMLADKDIIAVVKGLKSSIFAWKIAPLDVCRAASLKQMTEALEGEAVESFATIQEAFKLALEQTTTDQLILVCGSFHTLDAVWEYLESNSHE